MLLCALVVALSLGADPAPVGGGPAWQPPSAPAPAEYQLRNWQWRDGELQSDMPADPDPALPPPAGATSNTRAPAHYEETAAYYDPFSRQLAYGNAGYQPYRLGWYFADEMVSVPTSAVRDVSGSFQDLQYNAWARYARLVGSRHLFAWTGAWNTSWWTGPSGVALPPGADQLVSDVQVSSLHSGAWNWQAGITPQINADFRRSLDHNAYMVDGRFAVLYQASPTVRVAGGCAYWNRVHGILIPYGGLIWAPDSRWEFRMFFPQSRISRYYGKVADKDVWTYASAGYQVQAWQVSIQDTPSAKTRMQMSDLQFMLGTSASAGKWTAFAEGGLISDRRVLFRSHAPTFNINDNALMRIGLLY
ncbi:MAG TPA: hypothetical protein VHC22_05680 [Pirellulales bacterium]|nr:hypothetical protein [Pirellulales bacterium]